MVKIRLDPYIYFTGNCREAMQYYKEVFGGELTVSNYGEMAETPEMKDMVMHADLKGGLIEFMAADSTRQSFEDSFISLSLSGTDEERLRGLFEKLSEGASKIHPLKKESWGDIFGSLTDKYGIDWMMNIGPES